MTDKNVKKNNGRSRLQRLIGSLLAVAMIFGCAMFGVPAASAADFSIDTSKHKALNKNAETVYYWHEGLPPVTAVDGTKYPVLITWDDKYYLSADDSFGKAINDRKATRLSNYVKKAEWNDCINRLTSQLGVVAVANLGLQDKLISGDDLKNNVSPSMSLTGNFTSTTMYYSIYNGGSSTRTTATVPFSGLNNVRDYIMTYQKNSYGHPTVNSYARPVALYNMSSNAILANNPVYQEYKSISESSEEFIDELLKNGFAATTTIPNVPYLVCTEASPKSNTTDQSSSGGTGLYNTNQSRWAIWIPKQEGSSYFSEDNNWLVGMQHMDAEVIDYLGYTPAQGSNYRTDVLYDFYLDVMSGSDTFSNIASTGGPIYIYTPKEFIKKENKVTSPFFAQSAMHAPLISLEKRSWIFQKQSDGLYTIGTWCGFNCYLDNELTSYQGFFSAQKTNIEKMFAYTMLHSCDTLGTAQYMNLLHSGSKLVSRASTSIPSGTKGFRIFWGEPITVNYYRDSFSVMDGQVVNIDGPACIDKGAIYRVKAGGTLVMTDWVVNNGVIIVENGGTLILEENTDDYGHTRSCLLMSQTSGGDGGRIACEGTIIIMDGCKCFGGGKYGIQLGDGAYVVNYGTIGSENFTCYHDYTIENRGTESSVFAGYSVVGCGISLTNYRITGSTYPNQGNRESVFKVQIAQNAVYGPSSRRFYTNPSVPNADTRVAPRSGSVVNAVKYRELEWAYTANQFYDVTFPYYYDGGMLKSLWVYRNSTLRKYTTGEFDFEVPSNVSGINTPTIETVSGDEYVEIYEGNPGPQWQYPQSGRNVFYGYLKDWKPSGAVDYLTNN